MLNIKQILVYELTDLKSWIIAVFFGPGNLGNRHFEII